MQGAADQAKQVAGDVAAQAKDQATGQLANQKDRAASSLGGVADALRQTSQNLNQNEQSTVGNYVNQAADQVERFQGYLRNQDIGAIIDDVERMAREQPVMFLGGAFMLGLVAARFLKSSGQGGRYGSSYGRSRSYTTGGYGGGSYSSRSYGDRASTYGPSGTTTGSSYGSTATTGFSGATGTSYGAAQAGTIDSDFGASSPATGAATSSGTAGDYSPQSGTGLAGAETSDRTSTSVPGSDSSGSRSNRERGSTEGA